MRIFPNSILSHLDDNMMDVETLYLSDFIHLMNAIGNVRRFAIMGTKFHCDSHLVTSFEEQAVTQLRVIWCRRTRHSFFLLMFHEFFVESCLVNIHFDCVGLVVDEHFSFHLISSHGWHLKESVLATRTADPDLVQNCFD